jgi:hypothetical protein
MSHPLTRSPSTIRLTLINIRPFPKQPPRQLLIRMRLDTQRRADAQHLEQERQRPVLCVRERGRNAAVLAADERRVGGEVLGERERGGGGGV